MSLSQNPWLGHMSGSMSNVNTYVRHGQNVISSKAFNKKDAHTVSQIAHRASFKLMAKAYRSFGGLLRNNFPDKLVTESAYNFFMKLNLPEAIDKLSGLPVIDYSKLQVSQGGLLPVKVTTAIAGATGVTVSYKTNTQVADVSATDQVVAFGKTTENEIIIARQVRGSQALNTVLIPYQGIAAEDVACLYVLVMSEDGMQVSDSMFVTVS